MYLRVPVNGLETKSYTSNAELEGLRGGSVPAYRTFDRFTLVRVLAWRKGWRISGASSSRWAANLDRPTYVRNLKTFLLPRRRTECVTFNARNIKPGDLSFALFSSSPSP